MTMIDLGRMMCEDMNHASPVATWGDGNYLVTQIASELGRSEPGIRR